MARIAFGCETLDAELEQVLVGGFGNVVRIEVVIAGDAGMAFPKCFLDVHGNLIVAWLSIADRLL